MDRYRKELARTHELIMAAMRGMPINKEKRKEQEACAQAEKNLRFILNDDSAVKLDIRIDGLCNWHRNTPETFRTPIFMRGDWSKPIAKLVQRNENSLRTQELQGILLEAQACEEKAFQQAQFIAFPVR